MVAFTAVAIAITYALVDRFFEDVVDLDKAWGEPLEVVLMAGLASVVLWLGVLRPLHRQVERQQAMADERRREIEEAGAQQGFESRLHRALEMATTEGQARAITQRALSTAAPTGATQLMLADSSEAHLKVATSRDEDGAPLCGVGSPSECSALRRAQTMVFSSSGELDACPYLYDRVGGACSAACVPVSVGGRSIGVLHTVGPDGEPPSRQEVARLEAVADQAGSRIGMIRVMAATTLQASTDPLTGLLNRRSLEDQAHAMLRSGRRLAVAMCDLDHFKRLNDTHGHDAGDRALRLFARVLQQTLRDDDLVSRYGGEEFVIVFPSLDARQAAGALERTREALVVALADGTVPGFTCSFGVTDTGESQDLDELCQIADGALFRAKRSGRDRVEVDSGAAGHQPILPMPPLERGVDRPGDLHPFSVD